MYIVRWSIDRRIKEMEREEFKASKRIRVLLKQLRLTFHFRIPEAGAKRPEARRKTTRKVRTTNQKRIA